MIHTSGVQRIYTAVAVKKPSYKSPASLASSSLWMRKPLKYNVHTRGISTCSARTDINKKSLSGNIVTYDVFQEIYRS